MTKAEEARREKARQMRYRRPACKSMRWDYIRQDLQEIAEEVGDSSRATACGRRDQPGRILRIPARRCRRFRFAE